MSIMGILSRLFSSLPTKNYTDEKLGIFALAYRKGDKHLWTNQAATPTLTIAGTADQPFVSHLEFLYAYQDCVNALDDAITEKFKKEFHNADLDVFFLSWQERFIIVEVTIVLLVEQTAYWNITFEDKESPYYHFTLFIEGNTLTDFSIDS